ncbi:hypothetical protein F5Y18DRAFT_261631 [Xylariaceae sp. FL1019]|nr:hypothetical protein F5Y18DRAFT_261631 [Xylariaceae sp. FL1019]
MRWLLHCKSSRFRPRFHLYQIRPFARPLSTVSTSLYDAERIRVPVGSSGSVNIDLHNLAKVSSSVEPLLIYLPPFSNAGPVTNLAQLPRFAQKHATAVIHYRWTEPSWEDAVEDDKALDNEDPFRKPFRVGWPAPVHDTLKAYSWIVENLAPANYTRRDIYVYGSYLGASLATSLALTEAHPHERMGVRGCIAYNGIYNWTMFLPDHSMSKSAMPRNFFEEILHTPGDPDFQELKKMAGEWFLTPDNLFDPFASPCLFFHTPGLHVPPSFDESALQDSESSAEATWVSDDDDEVPIPRPTKSPRKSPLVFPPRKSTLKIPEMLFLHDTPPPLPPSQLRRQQRRTKKNFGNNFRTQADELAGLMRKSVNRVELRDRLKWDQEYDEWDDEAHRRIQVLDVGHNDPFTEVGAKGSNAAAAWLEEKASRRA